MTRYLPVPILLLGLATGLFAATIAEEVELSHSLATKVVTPHKDWGAGWVKGPVRALFLIYSGTWGGDWDQPGTRLREVIELMQRFDITGDAAYFGSTSGGDPWNFHGLKLGLDRVEKLLQKPYDLYVIGGFPMGKLPAKVQYEIMKPVSEGAGLLYCGKAPNEFLADKRKLDPLPAGVGDGLPYLADYGQNLAGVASAYRLGKGRGVWLNYEAHALAPTNVFSYRLLHEYDYRLLLVGRAALWAAGKSGTVEVSTALGKDPLKVQRAAPGAAEVVITNRGEASLAATVELALRRAEDGVVTKLPAQQADLVPGEPKTLSVTLPRLRCGDYYLDAVVKSARGTEACGAGSLVVEESYGVEGLVLDRSFIEQGETMGCQAVLRGDVPAGSTLRVRLRDSYGRVLRQNDHPASAEATAISFTYQADAFATILMRAEAALLVGGEEVEMKSASFTVPKRRHGRHNFVMWDAPDDVLGYYAWRKLQDAGQDTCLIGSMGNEPTKPRQVLSACDVSIVPYSTRILLDEKLYCSPVCWNDEPAVTEYVQKIVANQQLLREQGVFVYSLGDEGVTAGCCTRPSCLEAYRKWLEGQYGTIEKLNASWGATYASFDQVELLDSKDNMENAAAQTAPARWYDRQVFARHNLMQFVARFRDQYRQLDPQAQTGFEGTGGFGDDFDAIIAGSTFYGPYPSIGDDILRSTYPRERVRSNWMGYSKTGDALSDAAWRMVMKGMDSIWYWMWDGVGSYWGYIKPSLDFYPATGDVRDEMAVVRHGLGDLVINSQMLHSGIAVFYSLPSALSHGLGDSRDFLGPEQTHGVWTQLTYELGLDFRYLTSKMLTGGALTNQEFKVLVLPFTQALSPEEAAAIRQFVMGGGTVIADVRPGVYDGHCKPVTPGMLDDLFGIQRVAEGKGETVDLKLEAVFPGKTLRLDFPQTRVDTAVRATTAVARDESGETPLLLMNTVGKGGTVLLNLQLNQGGKGSPLTASSRSLLKTLYWYAGVRGVASVTAPDGGALPSSEARIWRNGNALLLGLWRHMENAWFAPTGGVIAGPPQPARITLPGPRHVYDLRAGKYLGKVSRVDTKLKWGRASFYLALPYRITGLGLKLSWTKPQPGLPLTADLRLQASGKVAESLPVWVEVIDPTGNKPLWGRQTVLLKGGVGQVRIPVAYNDRPGKWRLRATELFSGQSAEASWAVK